jgi:hypothetical protein
MSRTVVHHFRLQYQAFPALCRARSVNVWPYTVEAGLEDVAAAFQVAADARDVLRAEDAGGRRVYGLAEERTVQHLHRAVDGRREHVVWIVRHGIRSARPRSLCGLFDAFVSMSHSHESIRARVQHVRTTGMWLVGRRRRDKDSRVISRSWSSQQQPHTTPPESAAAPRTRSDVP